MYQNIGKTHYDEKELLDLWENTKHYVYNNCHQQGMSAIAAFVVNSSVVILIIFSRRLNVWNFIVTTDAKPMPLYAPI